MAITKNTRAYTGGKYNLEFDPNGNAGWIKDADGGHAVADVVTEKMGADVLARKHLGNVKYEDVSFKCGTGMSREFYNWIDTAIHLGAQRGAALQLHRLTHQTQTGGQRGAD
jgi:hypothetical protein